MSSLAEWALLVVNISILCLIVIVPATIFIIRWNEARARDRHPEWRHQLAHDLELEEMLAARRRIESACFEYEEAIRGAEIMKELEGYHD